MSDVWTIERHLEAGSDLGRALFDRFVANSGEDLFVHHFRVNEVAQMDDEFVGWIADAYDQVGCGNR